MSELKDRIIQTSIHLFEKQGFHRVSVDQIVKESGSSKGGFYHHFSSKDELLFVIHDYFISYVLTKAQEAKATTKSPTEKLHQMIQSFVTVFDLYQPHISVFYQESHYLQPMYDAQIHLKRDLYKQELVQVIHDGVESGEFRSELPIEITVMSILGMVNWLYKWYQKDGKNSIQEIADMFCDMILHSVLKDQTKKNPAYQSFFLIDQRFKVN